MPQTLDVKLFNVTFVLYFSSFIAYTLYAGLHKKSLTNVGAWLAALGVIPHTIAFFIRWQISGHIPLSNMYEYISLMGWMTVIMLLVVHFHYRRPLLGAFISPVIVMMIVAAALLPKDVNQSLMPALQSIWLHIHVSMAAIGSGCFLVSYAVSSIYLLRKFDQQQLDPALAKKMNLQTSLLTIAGPLVISLLALILGVRPQTPESFLLNPASGLNYGGFFVLFGLFFLIGTIALAVFWAGRKRDVTGYGGWIFSIAIFALLIGGLVVGMLIRNDLLGITHNLHQSHGEVAKSAWLIFEFIGATALVAIIIGLALIPVFFKISRRLNMIDSFDLKVLDEISYKTVSLGYPLYTVGALFAGAIWAEQAWGTFWSWDPKETGALIIWLFYSGYLHARYQRGWKGSRAAVLVVAGFLMIVLSFFGNYFFGGLHAYG